MHLPKAFREDRRKVWPAQIASQPSGTPIAFAEGGLHAKPLPCRLAVVRMQNAPP